ncbi:MAG: GNAT family N-acetyltransferase [Streptosporangiales bacterium]|nr:GNAT family N-acetyltransferase [Streptosporangiales bacterium]
MSVTVRVARTEEYAEVGDLTARVYIDAGFMGADTPYVADLRDAAGRGRDAVLLVAVDAHDRLVGSVTYATHGDAYAELAGPGEAEFRMLVVDSSARKLGTGTALVRACLDLARRDGCATMRLSTSPEMVAAHRLYERLGFRRTPERDWTPAPGHDLLAYALPG